MSKREIQVECVPVKGGINTELIARAIAKAILKELKKDERRKIHTDNREADRPC